MIEKHIWKPVTNASISNSKPSPRWGHSCCVINDQVVLFGGYADSIYMNDLWVYHTVNMQWTEIKSFGAVPSQRSNSSFHYDSINNRIVMFGGGGSNKTRFNTIHVLDWNTKIWTEVATKQNQACPWERTYHSSELLYPYLIVYGGEGVADLDDLWVFNLQTLKWFQIAAGGQKPCGRRFHSSCLIGNQFYVIAGCYSKYRPLSDVYMIDFTNLLVSGDLNELQWRQMQFQAASFLTRWGHACASLQSKIYIFGGRFSNDLNDILVLDTQTMKMKSIKAAPQSLPKPRRRACINFIGNCLLMFGGFNSEYFNDLHYINVSEGFPRPKKYYRNPSQIRKFVNRKQTSDMMIQTKEGELVYCHMGILMQNFETQSDLNSFIAKISKNEDKKSLISLLEIMYQGFGQHPLLSTYLHKPLPLTDQQKQSFLIHQLQKLDESSTSSYSSNLFSKKVLLKNQISNIMPLSDEQFGDFLQKNREKMYKDIEIVVNDQYILGSNSMMLASGSKFFQALCNPKWRVNVDSGEMKRVHVWIPNGNVVLMQIIINFVIFGLLVVPDNMSYQSWLEMYELSDFFSLKELCQIIVYTIWSKVDSKNIDQILCFSTRFDIQKLGLACSRIKLKQLEEQVTETLENRWMDICLKQNRFQIKQKILFKEQSVLTMKKKQSSLSTEGEKENYEICNE